MNIFKKAWLKIYSFTFYTFAYLLPWHEPKLIEGDGSLTKLPAKIKELGLNDIFLCADPGILSLGMVAPLEQAIKDAGLKYVLFSKIEPNPKIRDIEIGVKAYHDAGCKCIIAFGGGSAMDTAKAIGARIARPKKSIEQLGGLLKVMHKIPPLFAIPTTAGTGSETTVAAVVTNEVTHHKYAVNDLNLIPEYAVLDPLLTVGLPPFITACTGMDALTHAVEGYTCRSVPKHYQKLVEEAVPSIIHNVEKAYNNGKDIDARREMLYASFKAGAVFTRVGLSYVHPIAHTLGGLYGVPHGLANAVLLPHVMTYFGPCVYKKLAHLNDVCGLSKEGQTIEEKAKAFIAEIQRLDDSMKLTKKFEIYEKDIPQMIKWAQHESNSAYNPPRILDDKDLENIIRETCVIKKEDTTK